MKEDKNDDTNASSKKSKDSEENEKTANLFKVMGYDWPNAKVLISSTDNAIGGTITSLDALDESMKQVQNQTLTSLQPGLDRKIAQVYEPLKAELETARTQIHETKTSLGNMKSFIDDNKEALTTLISVNGKMTGLESQMNSVILRLDKLEINKSEKWNRNATIISIIVAIISTCFALAATIVAIMALN